MSELFDTAAHGSSSPRRKRREDPERSRGARSNGVADPRPLPSSADAEQGVLCSFLINPREVGGLCAEKQIGAGHFHMPAHGMIFGVLLEMWDAGRPIDLITLTQVLHDRHLLETCGGAAFLSGLFVFLPTAANAEYYLEILEEKATLRGIVRVCTTYAARGYDESEPVAGLLDEVEAAVLALAAGRFQAKAVSMKGYVMAAITAIEQLYERRGGITGLSTGLAELDRMTDGLHPGEMIVIAARPSMGKSALGMGIAEALAVDQGLPVAVFSLEMSSEQLVQRLLCTRAKVNLSRVRDGFLSERDFGALNAAGEAISKAPLFLDDTAGLSILELRAKARRLKTQHGLRAIVIDYLQLLRSPTRRAEENRQIEISEISAGLKGLAKELALPIVVLAQLNRNPEARAGGRPRLSDLRESGSIEQDADVVGLLVREEYYAEGEEEKAEAAGKATLILAKQRNGPVGDVPLTFLKEFTRFESRAASEA